MVNNDIFAAYSTVFVGFGDVAILYSMEKPRSFSPSMIGYFLAIRDLIKGIGVIVGMPILTKIFNLSDPVIGIIGIVSNMAASVYLGFATNRAMVFLCMYLSALRKIHRELPQFVR